MVDQNRAKFEQFGRYLLELMEVHQVPGVAVAILHEGRLASAGFGVTNVDHPLPVTDDTLFQIGSITKTFTGTIIMRLVEMGKLELEAKVRTYLPDFRVADEEVASQVSVRHLLTHTGGWVGDFFHNTGSGSDALARYVADMADLEQLAPLGQVWSYNNAGFAVAGRIIERITGQSYETALHDLLLEPLGMEQCYLNPADIMTLRYAVGHSLDDGQVTVSRPWALPRAIYPVGGVVTSVKELIRYARFHLADGTVDGGTSLLRPESLAAMRHQQAYIGGQYEAIGLTWFINHTNGLPVLSHGGGTTGQISLLLLVPEYQFAMAIVTNSEEGGRITRAARRWSLQHYLNLEETTPTLEILSQDHLVPYLGRYARPYQDVELLLEDGQLMALLTPKGSFPTEDVPPDPPPPPMRCAFYEIDHLLVLDGEYKDTHGLFIRRPDRSIGWLRFGLRIHRRVE